MAFTILSWNVEKFAGGRARLRTVSDHVEAQRPDVFAILEAYGVGLPDLLAERFGDYDFAVTKGRQAQEIVVGWRRGHFDQVLFAQKREFKVYNPYLRPGAQLSLRRQGRVYYVLFLHTDSGTEARDFGNRYEMLEHVWKLNAAIRSVERGEANARLIVMGDLNTMGLFFPSRRQAHEVVPEAGEIRALEMFARRHGMTVPRKSHPTTFNNGRYESDLDHVMASGAVELEPLGQRGGEDYRVRVEGWHQLQGARRTEFIENISDHCSLLVRVR